MTATYDAIASATLTSDTTVTFTSIPQTYTDLILVFKGSVNNDYWSAVARFNGDTGNNYSSTFIRNDAGSANTSRTSNAGYLTFGGTYGWRSSNLNASAVLHIMNYSNATTNKSTISRTGSERGTDIVVGLWRDTNPIDEISIYSSASGGGTSNLKNGSIVSLYGIKAE